MRYVIKGKIMIETYGLVTFINSYGKRGSILDSEFEYFIKAGNEVYVETFTELRCWHIVKSIYLDNLTMEHKTILIDGNEYNIEKIVPTDNDCYICYIDMVIRTEIDNECLEIVNQRKAKYDNMKEAYKTSLIEAVIDEPKEKVKDMKKSYLVITTLKSVGRAFVDGLLRTFGFYKKEDSNCSK